MPSALTPEQSQLVDRAIAELDRRGSMVYPCPSCKNGSGAVFCMAISAFPLPFASPPEQKTLQFFMRVCTKCGRTDFHNLGVIGLDQAP